MPGQQAALSSSGGFITYLQSRLHGIESALTKLLPSAGGVAVNDGALDMNGNSITEAKSITCNTLVWKKMSPSVGGLKYCATSASPALVNSIIVTPLTPATAIGSRVFAADTLTVGSIINLSNSFLASSSGATLTIRVTVNGSAVIAHTVAVGTANDVGVTMESTIVLSSSGTSALFKSRCTTNGIAASVKTGTFGIMPSAENSIGITGEWSAASASNTASTNIFIIDCAQ